MSQQINERCPSCRQWGPNGLVPAKDHYFGTEEEFIFKRCPACGHLWLWQTSEFGVRKFGRGEFGAHEEAVIFAVMDHPLLSLTFYQPRVAWLGRQVCLDRNSVVLDVGCGTGQFLSLMSRRYRCQCLGVDFDPAFAQLPAKPGIELVTTYFEMYETDQRFDLITMLHVLEHLDDPETAIRKAYNLLKPGGYLFVETPASDSLAFKVFGSNWVALMPPYHHHIFSRESLRKMLSAGEKYQYQVAISGVAVPWEIVLSSWVPLAPYAPLPFRVRSIPWPVKAVAGLAMGALTALATPVELLVAASAGLVDWLSAGRLLVVSHQRALCRKI